jgi:tRNA nucleotidyltransferase/poly(A) polymerase
VQNRVVIPAHEPWSSGHAVAAQLMAAGFETYAAGGCVRDLLLGQPVHDIDIATAAHPEQVETLFREVGWRTVAVGKSFGVVVVVAPSGLNVEVATFRTDGSYIDGRRPDSVVFSTAAEDVARRDFTINALLLDLVSGEVADHVAGRADLAAGAVRAVGDPMARLREDRLRVLRALRFAARLDFRIESATWAAVCSTTLEGLSAERLIQELDKALAGPGRSRWLGLLVDSGHLRELCPALADLPADALVALGRRLDRLETQDPLAVRLASWLEPADPIAARTWLLSRPLPATVVRNVQWLLDQVHAVDALPIRPVAERRRLWRHAAGPLLVRLLVLCRDEAIRTLVDEAVAEQQREWRPPLRADDLLALGLAPGPRLGAMLRTIEDAHLEGRIADRSAALELARQLIAKEEKPGQSGPGTR